MRWDKDRRLYFCECGQSFFFKVNADYHQFLGHDRLVEKVAESVVHDFDEEMQSDLRQMENQI